MYVIKWTDKAQEEYLKTLSFWITHNKSKTFSQKIMSEVIKAEKYLSATPFSNSLLDTARKIYKAPILKHFSLIYTIDNKTVIIVSFWDNRRNPDDLKI